MEDIDLWYTAPVCVEVRDGRISKVVVDDERLKEDHNHAATPGAARDAQAAYEAVDKMDWPAWQFGW